MINSIGSSPYSVQVLPSAEPKSQDQLNREALKPTTQAQQVQNAQPLHATVNTSGQTVGSVIDVVA